MKFIGEHGSVIGMVLAFMSITLLATNLFIVQPLEKELEHEKLINTYAVEQFNKMSTKAKQYKDRVEELENANEAMMQYCTPSSIVRAIKATPLIPLVQET